jgi:tetratricopeptide (TPR) repeat protein/tRNA A-37 threonylcarbamoyl transferase component Bud32
MGEDADPSHADVERGGGNRSEAVAQLHIAQMTAIGRYQVLSKLGHGAMGIVYACYDARLDRRVAVKILRSDRRTEKVRVRMVREARAMAKLNHPNVAHVYEVGEWSGRAFVAMEYIHGKTLREWGRSRRRGWRDALALGLAAARGLAAAHAEGLTHRDFKPDNVMVGDDGRVRVMDFGLVRFDDNTTLDEEHLDVAGASAMTLTRRGTVLGTPVYMAPEQIHDPEGGPAADQFAFCVTLWELLFGVRPFGGDDLDALEAEVRRGRPTRGARSRAAPRWLRRVLERGLSYAPRDRHASMPALIRALERGSLHARLRGAAAGMAVLGVAGFAHAGAAAIDRDRGVQRCRDDADAWVATVDEAPRAAAVAGLRAVPSPVAATTADAVEPFLAAQAEALRTASSTACMRADVDGTASADLHDRATWCLDQRHAELAAVLDGFAQANVDLLLEAVSQASSLEPTARCLDDDALARIPLPPVEQRAEIRALQAELAREAVTRPADRVARLAAFEPAVDATGWDPLRARLRLLHGRATWFAGDVRAAGPRIAEAYFIAARSRDWSAAADAAISLIELEGRWMRRREEGLVWAQHAEVALAKAADRLGLHEAHRRGALSALHEAEGEGALAREHVEAALAIEEPLLPDDHPRIASRLDQLGVLARNSGDYDTMIDACSRALAIRESVFGAQHSETMESLVNLGVALQDTGSYARAKQLHERALAITERIDRPGSMMLAIHHANLGVVASGLGEHAEAREHFERAIAIREDNLGPTHPGVGAMRRMLGEALLEAGDVEDARSQLERALAIYEAALGSEHFDVARHLQFLARAHTAAGAHATAEQLHARALAIALAAVGEGSLDHGFTLEGQVEALRAAGQLDRARDLARTVVAMHERNLGPEHPTTAYMIAELGAIELEAGEAEAAREHLERAVDLFGDRAVFRDAEHVARFALARALILTGGDRGRAIALATIARDAWRELPRTRARELAEAEAFLQEHARP